MLLSHRVFHLSFSLIRSRHCSLSLSRTYSKTTKSRNGFVQVHEAKTWASEGSSQSLHLPLSERDFCCEATVQDVTNWVEIAKLQTESEAKSINGNDDPSPRDLLVRILDSITAMRLQA